MVLQVNTPEYGLGVTLLQPATYPGNSTAMHWQPVAYSSSSLSPPEQRYTQIEKETLAIVHAFCKFDQLLFGKSKVTVLSDHKPLETIFTMPFGLCSTPFAEYDCSNFSITHSRWSITGSSPHIADTLSCAPLPERTHKEVHDVLVSEWSLKLTTPSSLVSRLPLYRRSELNQAQILNSKVYILVTTGWPGDRKPALPCA